jgi:hypothetical protein
MKPLRIYYLLAGRLGTSQYVSGHLNTGFCGFLLSLQMLRRFSSSKCNCMLLMHHPPPPALEPQNYYSTSTDYLPIEHSEIMNLTDGW